MTHATTATPTPADLGDALARLRERQPLVQCITNAVVSGWTANVLLATGAAPAMVDNPLEAPEFAAIADGLLVNVGTPTEATLEAMRAAISSADASGTPWVLDPVAIGGLGWRTAFVPELLEIATPTIVRGNASEIAALAGGAGGRGVESTDAPEQVLTPARTVARRGSVVAISGEVDHLLALTPSTDGAGGDQEVLVRLGHGDPLLTRVTGAGCALGALMAAFAGVCDDALTAAAAATATLTLAAETAAESARGPGSFAVALLDELSLTTPDGLAERVHLA